MHVQYLEIVTPDVAAACAIYASVHNVIFSEPNQILGNARTAKFASGGLLGIRAPMHAGEKPVVRPYILVGDIEAAVSAAVVVGAAVIVPPMKLAGYGTCAILHRDGIESGLWQL